VSCSKAVHEAWVGEEIVMKEWDVDLQEVIIVAGGEIPPWFCAIKTSHSQQAVLCITLTMIAPPTGMATLRVFRTLTGKAVISSKSFSTSRKMLKNRIYPSTIRSESELETLTLMSASTRTPLITLWMTNWCASCKTISPLIRSLVQDDKIGESQGCVSYAEVEMDSPDMGGLGGLPLRYGINSIPTLLAFDRQEPQVQTKVAKLDDLKSKEFLRKWIETEAARHGSGGAGGTFGGLFGR
jgi:thiol-disulfide isomerase/thioredoxin